MPLAHRGSTGRIKLRAVESGTEIRVGGDTRSSLADTGTGLGLGHQYRDRRRRGVDTGTRIGVGEE
eukprot:3933948-Rhodomonas_salina.1